MNFPEQVFFKIINSATKQPAEKIAVSLVLYAHRKNDYYIGPKLTNKEGIVSFDRSECMKGIESSRKFYLMDYSSTLEECLPKVSIKIKPKKELGFTAKNMRSLRDIYQQYWDCSEEYLKSLESADNYKYVSKLYDFLESDLWQNKVLEIKLEPV